MAVTVEKFKIVFLGDICVGKTSLVTRFMYDSFDRKYKSTVGIDFFCKTVTIGDTSVKLQLWDTAGQERFRSLLSGYIRDSAVAIVCFDVSNKESFIDIEKWVKDVRMERMDMATLIIVGNKTDKVNEREAG